MVVYEDDCDDDDLNHLPVSRFAYDLKYLNHKICGQHMVFGFFLKKKSNKIPFIRFRICTNMVINNITIIIITIITKTNGVIIVEL